MSRFDYVKYDEQSVEIQAEIKKKCEELEASIEKLNPGRYKSLALTDIESVYMWAGKAIRDEQIARNGAAPLQEQRCNS